MANAVTPDARAAHVNKVWGHVLGQLDAGSARPAVHKGFLALIGDTGLVEVARRYTTLVGYACTITLGDDNEMYRLVPRFPELLETQTVGERQRVPRPPNAFILYRQHFHRIIKATQPDLDNNEISKVIGAQWKREDDAVKAIWKKKSDDAKAKHKEEYPGYQYQPRKPGERKRRMTRRRREAFDAAARIEIPEEHKVADIGFSPDPNVPGRVVPPHYEGDFPGFFPNLDTNMQTMEIDHRYTDVIINDGIYGVNSMFMHHAVPPPTHPYASEGVPRTYGGTLDYHENLRNVAHVYGPGSSMFHVENPENPPIFAEVRETGMRPIPFTQTSSAQNTPVTTVDEFAGNEAVRMTNLMNDPSISGHFGA